MAKLKKGTFNAIVRAIKKKDGRYFLHLELIDPNVRIKIDIHDYICENLGSSNLSDDNIKRILYGFPNTIEVTNMYGFWEIRNESSILSQAISKIAY